MRRLLLLPLQLLLTARLDLLRAQLQEREIGTVQDEKHDRGMEEGRQHDPLAPADGAANDELVLVAIVEIEMNQGETRIITFGPAIT